MKYFHLLPVILALAFTTACYNYKNSHAETESFNTAWPALALLKTGDNPLWFELGPFGPDLIESPAAATLVPFTPWPHAKFVTGMLLWQDSLVMAVNRDGFLVLGPGDTADLVLYRVADTFFWDPYTSESFFIWDDKPALLLYRNDFFSAPIAPPPEPQVYLLDKTSSVPLGVRIPALENLAESGFWEAELLRRGNDGFWYYRVREKSGIESETAYFRTGDLAAEGKKISVDEWRNSSQPEITGIPLHLTAVLEKVSELIHTPVARTVSPDFEGQRLFCARGGRSEETVLLHAYCRETPQALAIAILPDGRGFCSPGANNDARSFSLPVLPEGFVYSGIAMLGNNLAASWEEQQDAGIGAAGFMVMALSFMLDY